MHGDVAVFFGLSGTGKTTLSADPARRLIGDDEHGWGVNGVFNIEGGCYAKVIRLSDEAEPDIYRTTRTYGTILENVVVDERGVVDLDDGSKTENTRAAYPLEQIPNALPAKMAGHPGNVVFLTADAFGILPPIARLSRAQALYWFLSGFTAKLAGTEIGVTEPQPTFSTCFGAPFLPQRPSVYAHMLGEKLDAHGSSVWLVNTGWTGGPFGEGHRMPIAATRALLSAALTGHSTMRGTGSTPCSASRCRSPCPVWTRRCSTLVRHGRTRARTTTRRATSQSASAPTSRRSTRTTPVPRSRPAALPPRERQAAPARRHRRGLSCSRLEKPAGSQSTPVFRSSATRDKRRRGDRAPEPCPSRYRRHRSRAAHRHRRVPRRSQHPLHSLAAVQRDPIASGSMHDVLVVGAGLCGMRPTIVGLDRGAHAGETGTDDEHVVHRPDAIGSRCTAARVRGVRSTGNAAVPMSGA